MGGLMRLPPARPAWHLSMPQRTVSRATPHLLPPPTSYPLTPAHASRIPHRLLLRTRNPQCSKFPGAVLAHLRRPIPPIRLHRLPSLLSASTLRACPVAKNFRQFPGSHEPAGFQEPETAHSLELRRRGDSRSFGKSSGDTASPLSGRVQATAIASMSSIRSYKHRMVHVSFRPQVRRTAADDSFVKRAQAVCPDGSPSGCPCSCQAPFCGQTEHFGSAWDMVFEQRNPGDFRQVFERENPKKCGPCDEAGTSRALRPGIP